LNNSSMTKNSRNCPTSSPRGKSASSQESIPVVLAIRRLKPATTNGNYSLNHFAAGWAR
jgi:hypothetical protein